MNKLFLLLLVSISLFACKNSSSKEASLNNKLQPVVMDYSKLFTDSQTDSLTHKIIVYEQNSTNEIAIITKDSIPKDEKIQMYATRLGQQLGVGKKDKNNGLLILIAPNDRQVSIATGYGTEKILTDYICKVIIDSTMIPKFKNQDYYGGVNSALDSIIAKWH